MRDRLIPEQLLCRLDKLLEQKQPVVLAIDGRCASGKTTLAEALEKHYGCTVIPMDHFFLRPEQRTRERLDTPGGNIDHERFLEEVLLPLRRNEAFCYCPFDCSVMALGTPVEVQPGKLIVVEGSYSCVEPLRKYYDLRIFLTVEPELQMKRLIRRNGAYAEVFRTRWIPMEERYFSAQRIASICDLTVDTSE